VRDLRGVRYPVRIPGIKHQRRITGRQRIGDEGADRLATMASLLVGTGGAGHRVLGKKTSPVGKADKENLTRWHAKSGILLGRR